MDDKYYVPEKEEFHIGFEYEIYEDFDSLPKKSWHKLVYGDAGTGEEDMGHPFPCDNTVDDRIRVEFLTREQIEKEGFVKDSGDYDFIIPETRYQLEIHNNYGKYCTVHITEDYGNHLLHHGLCKNISKLRTILKDVGVKS